MDWETKRIKDLVTDNELTLSDSTNPNYEFDYVDIGSVSQFKIAETEIMSFFEAPSRARRIVRKNDILVSTVRTYLKAITYIDFEPKDLIVSTGFAVMTPKKKTNPKFLSYAIESDYFIDDVIKDSVGTSYPAINASKLESLEVLLPPESTQQKIASFLDSKTQNIDARIEILVKKKERYTKLRKALINEAVDGEGKEWKTVRMKDVFSFSKGLSITKENLEENIQKSYQEILKLQKDIQKIEQSVSNVYSASGTQSIMMDATLTKMELQVQEQIYAQLKAQYESLKITMASEQPVFQILNYAEVPEQKSGPSRGKIMIIASFAAFFIAIFIAFLLNAIKNIKNDPEAMKKLKTKR